MKRGYVNILHNDWFFYTIKNNKLMYTNTYLHQVSFGLCESGIKVSELSAKYPNTEYDRYDLVTSCCQGNGGSRWDYQKATWNCIDCGQLQSTDPSYLYNKDKDKDSVILDPAGHYYLKDKVCECGSTKLGSDKHSTWCPKFT